MAEKAQGIARLKKAEQEASEIIEAARRERDRRAKEAQAKAHAEVLKYERDLDAEFEQFKTSSGGSSEEVFRKLRATTDAQIHDLTAQAKRNKDAIVAKLLQYVAQVNTDVHPNITVAQKLGFLK